MAGTTEPLAEKPKTFDTVGDLPAMPKLNEGASKLTGASKAEFEKALGVYQPFLTAQEGMVKGLGRAESDILQSEQEQKRIQATGTSAAAQKQIADIEKGQRDLDEAMQKEPIPKFVPTKETADDLVVLFSLVNVMGFLIGGAGKENSQAAMSAMNGMLEGHQKGRADLYKQELSEFDKNFKAMVQKHAEFRKRYEDAVKLAAVDKEAGVAQAELVATEYGSEVVKAKAKKGDILGGLEILNSGLNAVKEAQKRVEKIEDEANKRQYELDKEKDRRKFELDMQKASFAHAEKIAKERAGAKATGAGSDTASDVKNFLGVNFGSGKQADAKYDQAAAAANTTAEALALSNVVRKNPDVVGRVGQAKSFIDRYVRSLNSDGLETDKTPAATNQAEQDALLFSKRYASYLIRYEQALAGSSKGFTVSFMNRFNNLMQQNQFNPEGFDGLMKEQIREIAAKSAVLSTKITPENLMRLGVAQTRDPDAIEAFGRMQRGGASSSSGAAGGTRPAGAPAEAKQAADGKWYSKDPQTGKYIRWD